MSREVCEGGMGAARWKFVVKDNGYFIPLFILRRSCRNPGLHSLELYSTLSHPIKVDILRWAAPERK